MKKKIIFFDGDGTLWYPTKTKREEKPHWVYEHPDTKDNYLEHLTLTPDAKKTLEVLQSKGIYLVVISANPYAEHIAVSQIKERLQHFGLTSFFYAVKSSPGADPKGKGVVMLEILKELNIDKKDALMVGDSYYYDYVAAQDVGVDALWIENFASKLPDTLPDDVKRIRDINDVFTFLTFAL